MCSLRSRRILLQLCNLLLACAVVLCIEYTQPPPVVTMQKIVTSIHRAPAPTETTAPITSASTNRKLPNNGSFHKSPTTITLRTMTFNTWNNGKNVDSGVRKLANHIIANDPDVVALQEVMLGYYETLLYYLGPSWSGFYRHGEYPDTAIVTRHHLNRSSIVMLEYAVGCQIRLRHELGGHVINVWSVHTDYHNYGPYAACNRLVTNAFQIEAGEYNIFETVPGRVQNILELGAQATFMGHLRQADGPEKIPMIVMGDFNAPSHLDWTEAAKHLHCDRVFTWPVSKLMEEYGFIDAFRELYPNPVTHPGNTWSTVTPYAEGWGWTIPEPQDRIDFIYYRSKRLHPIGCFTYEGNSSVSPKPYYVSNSYPSDHFAVVADFKVYLGDFEVKRNEKNIKA